jgi:glucose-6-phosphate isomerase
VEKGSVPLLLAADPTVFAAPGDPAFESVSSRLGWVHAPVAMPALVPRVQAFAEAAAADGLTRVYLLGMGGSSLCAEVLRDVPLPRRGRTGLTVLDTTDERTIRDVTASLDPDSALFIVASKSGSTVEVSSLERHFMAEMRAVAGGAAPRHFVAITDPGTPLAARAGAAGYRDIFLNPADIGGRFSALSLFGLVPAALLGIDADAILASAGRMMARCLAETPANPGLALGLFMGEHAAAGRDKLTLLLPPALEPLGAWIEQLVAESTGKQGRGVLPVVGEPAGSPAEYGPDRMFVGVETGASPEVAALADALAAGGRPVFRIQTAPEELGGEFFRWEVATAVAGRVLGVNPFDEPNVREAKERTRRQLETFTRTGAFAVDPPLEPVNGVKRRVHERGARAADPSGDYIALLDYLPADPRRHAAVVRLRRAIRQRTGLASTYGVGPRYLHSTGQYHKGGPNTGRFVLLTAADATTTPVPGEPYSFRTLKQAQALGDFEALVAAGRDVVHVHVDDPAADYSAAMEAAVLASL